MPRICKSDNEPVDVCLSCWYNGDGCYARAKELFGNIGDGPDGRGNCFERDVEHPPYDSADYRCVFCGKKLTIQDA